MNISNQQGWLDPLACVIPLDESYSIEYSPPSPTAKNIKPNKLAAHWLILVVPIVKNLSILCVMNGFY